MDNEFQYKHFTLQAHVRYDKESIRSINEEIFDHVSDGWVIDHYDTTCSEEYIHKFYILKKSLTSNKISES